MRFSYTDDAVVSSSPTGRHLSTVIRRPCVLMSGWDEHAAEICKVLNELSPAAKSGATVTSLRDCGYGSTLTVADLVKQDYRPQSSYGKIPDVILQNWPKTAENIDSAPGLQYLGDDLQELTAPVMAELRSAKLGLGVAYITLSAAEIQSGYDRVKWAEGLIRQLPESHDGRNSWLMNYGQNLPPRAECAAKRTFAEKAFPEGSTELNAKDEELDKLRKQQESAYLDNVEAQRKANGPIYVGGALARVLLNTAPGTTVLHGNRTFQRGS